MCNPNSSIANRRHRAALPSQLQTATSKTSAMLTQNLLGSMFINAGVRDGCAVNRSTGYTVPSSPPQAPPAPSNSSYPYHFSVPTTLSAFQHLRNSNPEVPKPKTKRRRKPQKPGKTAKQNDRHFVVHDYHDHANDTDNGEDDHEQNKRRGGVAVSFPIKLHQVLDQVEADGLSYVVSWQPHGRCFVIHKPKEFTEHIMPHYFRQTKLTSFQRQLNLYGFQRLTRGADSGGYYHELFLRGKEFLCKHMIRTKVKGTKFKAASSPEQEPDFYTMPPVVSVTPSSSDCDNSDDGHVYSMRAPPPPEMLPIQRQPEAVDVFASMTYRPLTTPQLPEISPIPYSPYTTVQQMSSPMPAPMPSPRRFSKPSPAMITGRPGDVLDEAVDELFLNDNQHNDTILDFVSAWDPAAYGPDALLTNDVQLGNLLDRLLEE